MDFKLSAEKIRKYFHGYGINTDMPGFYDDPKFLELEKENPNLLNSYASLINQTIFDKKYLDEAEKKITGVASILNNELKKDGRQGACIDSSTVLSRILDKEGIWNYISKGSLTITFPPGSGVTKKYFWTIDTGEYAAAHAWVIAPPFKLVDISVRQQPYSGSEESYLPDIILQKEVMYSKVDLADIVAPQILAYLKSATGGNKQLMMASLGPNLAPFTSFFKPFSFTLNKVNYKYTPTGIAASDLPLEEITSLKLNGRYGIDIYQSQILNKRIIE